MKKISLAIVLLILGPGLAAQSSQLELHEVAGTVAYLHAHKPETVDLGGVPHEVWLKGPENDEPVRRLKPTSGTGFFVKRSSQYFLVTAGHVAKSLLQDPRITVVGADGKQRPFHSRLSLATTPPGSTVPMPT